MPIFGMTGKASSISTGGIMVTTTPIAPGIDQTGLLRERPESQQYSLTRSSGHSLEESTGAPIETVSPLGSNVGIFSAISLNMSRMLGMGIYSTPGVILNSVGSVGMSLVLWIIGSLMCFAGLDLYNELASMFPKRSGGDVVFLEQAYPRPKLLLPTTFAFSSVMLSFSAINATVFAHYTLYALDLPVTPFRQHLLATVLVTVAALACGLSTRWSLRLVNTLVIVKFIQAFLVIYTGFMVVIGRFEVPNAGANFREMFNGTSWNLNAIATAVLKIDYAYGGWNHAINLLAEVQGAPSATGLPSRSPIHTIRLAGYLSLTLASILFLFVNLSFFAAVPKEQLRKSGSLAAAIFFETVYGKGSRIASKVFPVLIILSCVGGTVSSTLGVARIVREVARQGILPYPEVWSSTYPFGTPLPPILLKYVLSVIVIIAPPAEDAFNFLLDLATYPGLVFSALVAIGVWIIRKRHKRSSIPPSPYKASNVFVTAYLVKSICTLIFPWVPPAAGSGDVSMWYATYCVVGLAVIFASAMYYYVWIHLLPRIGGYILVEEVVELPGGALTNRLVRKRLSSATEGIRRRAHNDTRPEERTPLLATTL